MITRIEIDGFKTFQDFAVDLEPFQVIIGPNGCGKSNFFDALDLLSKIATSDLRTAFKGIRGDINELFTVLPNGKSADRMRFAVEMLVDQLHSGEELSRKLLRMQYAIQIQRRTNTTGMEELVVHSEQLMPISSENDNWAKHHAPMARVGYPIETPDNRLFNVTHEDIASEIIANTKNQTWPELFDIDAYNNMLKNAITTVDTAYIKYGQTKQSLHGIAQQELSKLRMLRLDTNALRKSSSFFDEPVLTTTGENLAATLARIQIQDKPLLKNVSRDVSSIVPNFAGIEVDRDTGQKRITLYANMKDKRRFSMEALSEGTLRVLALATLRNDPHLEGTLCFEDPEAGVHPGAFARIVKMLRSMATDLDDPEDTKLPLRQVLVTTHSPELVSHLNIEQGELLFADSVTRVVPDDAAWRVTRITPVCSDEEQGPAQTYALSKVIEYLNNPGAAEKQNSLREAMLR